MTEENDIYILKHLSAFGGCPNPGEGSTTTKKQKAVEHSKGHMLFIEDYQLELNDTISPEISHDKDVCQFNKGGYIQYKIKSSFGIYTINPNKMRRDFWDWPYKHRKTQRNIALGQFLSEKR